MEKKKDPVVLIQALFRGRRQRKLFKKILKCSYVAKEIYDTEKTYVTSLGIVVENYKKPLLERSVIGKKEVETMFFGIEEIYSCHETFLKNLETKTERWTVYNTFSDIFVTLSSSLEVYTSFVNNYDVALETLRKMKQNASFNLFITETESQTKRNKLTLSDMLIMPIQRIPRYALLLGLYSDNLSKSHPDKQKLTVAIDGIKKVATYIDAKKGEVMSRAKVSETQSMLMGDVPTLSNGKRLYVKELDVVMLVDGIRALRRVFFFDDALVCALPNGMNSRKQTFDFEWLMLIETITQVAPVPSDKFHLIRGTNFIEPSLIMQEIQLLSSEMDKERKIEETTARIVQLYKQENSTNYKPHLKGTTDITESTIEQLDKRLKKNQELMRLFEPIFGLAIATSEKKVVLMVFRSAPQREEMMKTINDYRIKLGKPVRIEEAEELFNSNEKKKDKKDEGLFSSITKSIASSSAQTLTAIAKFLGSDEQKPKGRYLGPGGAPIGGSGAKTMPHRHSNDKLASRPSSENLKLDAHNYLTHDFVTKVFKKPVHCDFCGEMIWGLGREGVKCKDCSYRAHRKCYKMVPVVCSKTRDVITDALDEDTNRDDDSTTKDDDSTKDGSSIQSPI